MDAFDGATLALLALLSSWFLVVLLWRAGPDRVWTGTDGLLPGDQQQYLAWIRLAAHDVLISDPYRLEPSAASFLHPGLVISGGLHALGVSPPVAYLLWKPVAVVALFASVRCYVRALVAGRWARRAALVLALFAVAPAVAVTGSLGLSGPTRAQLGFISHEMWAGFWLWGYPFTTLAIAAVPGALLAYGRDRADGRVRAWAPLLALLASWLQPWQGATLIGILVATEGLRLIGALRGEETGPRVAQARRVLAPLAVTVVAGLAPLAYYWGLSRWDPSWGIARALNLREAAVWWRALLVAAVPLGLPALLALRIRPATFQDLALRVWPVMALGLYVLIAVGKVGTYPLHALQGLAIPLAVLAVIGVAGVPWRAGRPVAAALTVAALALLVVPGTVNELRRSLRDADGVRVSDGLRPAARLRRPRRRAGRGAAAPGGPILSDAPCPSPSAFGPTSPSP